MSIASVSISVTGSSACGDADQDQDAEREAATTRRGRRAFPAASTADSGLGLGVEEGEDCGAGVTQVGAEHGLRCGDSEGTRLGLRTSYCTLRDWRPAQQVTLVTNGGCPGLRAHDGTVRTDSGVAVSVDLPEDGGGDALEAPETPEARTRRPLSVSFEDVNGNVAAPGVTVTLQHPPDNDNK